MQTVQSQNVDYLASIKDITTRGYTGHEHVEHADIIHMNGRIYDPTLGRFLQADPFIQAPMNSQSYNRYSYVLNNPLSYTDPSGYFFKAIGNVFKKALREITKVPILNLAAQAAACYFGGPWGCAAYASASTYAVTGSLKAAFTSGVVSYISPGGGSWGNIATSAIIGGLASKAQGGNFGHGFWSAGLGAGLGGRIKLGNPVANVIVSAIVGGTVSKLTGGKFANGAQTWAFSAAMKQDWGTENIETEQNGKSSLYPKDRKNEILAPKITVDKDGNITFTDKVTVSYSGIDEATAQAYIESAEAGWEELSLDLELVSGSDGDLTISPCTDVCSVHPIDGGYLGAAAVGGRSIYYGASQFTDTPVHEFGHILGLSHTGTLRGSIMGGFRPRTVNSQDLSRLRRLYE
ncbi:RHS repeat-associated core domain-containing protein [Agaribacter flavus]|uniref:RHS repeat-associated core domain-containing protein n=1 Tax=Agaribacter flavus TaxID=1902781 RepID=A0ABV7FU63_9ALTE